jgi:hypothetical protein
MSAHIGELAELYALGALEPEEHARVDEHIARCPDCLRRVGEAEKSVTEMMRLEPQSRPPASLDARLKTTARNPAFLVRPNRAPWFAIAAAFVVGLLPAMYLWQQYTSMHGSLSQGDAIVAQLAHAPMRSAAFAAVRSAGVQARVLYNDAGSWYCVLVKHPQHPMDVAYVHPDGSMEKIGSVTMRGDTGVAVLPIPHKMGKLALLDGHTVVAEALLLY